MLNVIQVNFANRCRSTRKVEPWMSWPYPELRAVMACQSVVELDALVASWREEARQIG